MAAALAEYEQVSKEVPGDFRPYLCQVQVAEHEGQVAWRVMVGAEDVALQAENLGVLGGSLWGGC